MKTRLNKFLEQIMGRAPLPGKSADEDDLAKDIESAKEGDNPQLTNLLTRKQNLTANMNKIQDQIKELDVQIAQAKTSVEEPE